MSAATGPHKELSFARLLPGVVAVAATACALLLYARFLQSPRLLWSDAIHDRNAHLYSGLCLAMDLRLGDIRHLFGDLDSFRTWPPLHDGFLVGAALLAGGGDERWAVLPSLIAWAASAVFVFLLARRCSPRAGSIAGLFAATLLLASPAQRAYATDVMIESLGACLSAACLYFYVASVQDCTPRAYRLLGLSLTLLFFTKYNYWFLVVTGILADRIAANPRQPVIWARNLAVWCKESRWFTAQFRRPANYFVLFVLVVAAALALTGGGVFKLFGANLTIRPSPNLVTIVYAVCFFRLLPWYRRRGRAMVREAGDAVQEIVHWHLWPIALWFLWPHRFYSFLWVLDPASNAGEVPRHDLIGGYVSYWNSFAGDYHESLWSAILVAALLLIAFWAAFRMKVRPGSTAVLWFVAIALLLTVHHQNRKSRFLHSWIPLVWVGAGIGAASLAPKRSKGENAATWLCYVSAAGVVILAHFPGLAASAHAPEGGIHPSSPSNLDITDAYLPDLAESRHAAVFSNLPMKYLAQWTYLKRYRRTQRLETDVKGFEPPAAGGSALLSRWAATTDCDTVVYADFPPTSTFYSMVPGYEYLSQYRTMMETQTQFKVVHRHTFPQYGCTVTVWARLPASPGEIQK